ncbi:MAG TPA: SGNH/GDSL hydrolase family protein [Egicoccus sp.]|nr:SGNH/GDSL hydrolase family protein [Egicoccus sp.]HSK22699.1 SGNH/GDSL hydrolase family protein [Egicoccus sp.]
MVTHRLVPTVLLTAALVLAGCDDGGMPDATPSSPEPTATATETSAPEASAPDADPSATAGNDTDAGAVSYVALGDSLATGAGATTSYVEVLAAELEQRTGADLEVTNLAVNGWTSTDLIGALQQDETMRTAVAGADLLTVDIGANDLLGAIPFYASDNCGGDDNLQCLRDATTLVESQWAAILDEIIALRDGNATGIATIDLYQPFIGNRRVAEDLEVLRPVMDDLNAVITDVAQERDIPVATVHDAFHGPDGTGDPNETFLISVDGLHPSNAGHEVIARELLALDVDWAHAG